MTPADTVLVAVLAIAFVITCICATIDQARGGTHEDAIATVGVSAFCVCLIAIPALGLVFLAEHLVVSWH